MTNIALYARGDSLLQTTPSHLLALDLPVGIRYTLNGRTNRRNADHLMRTQSIDTSPDAERVLIDMIRMASFTRRFSFVQSWSHAMIEGGRINVQQLYPQADEQEALLLYAERHYAKDVVDEWRAALQECVVHPSGIPD